MSEDELLDMDSFLNDDVILMTILVKKVLYLLKLTYKIYPYPSAVETKNPYKKP